VPALLTDSRSRFGRGPEHGPPGACRIRVASYNIHVAIGRDGRYSPRRIARVIDEMQVDAVALQEVAMGAPGFNLLHYLEKACGMQAIAGPTLKTSYGQYGNAVLTRHAAFNVRRWDLSVARREPRGAIDLQFDCRGQTLRVLATHLGLWPGERRRQIRRLLQIIEAGERVPIVLLGDLNEWYLWGRPMRWLHRHFKKCPAPATFPSGRPVFALDRIWVEPRGVIHNVGVHASALSRMASDHLPVVATLDFTGGAAVQIAQHS
jgi:phospholipase D1/2